MKRHLVRVCVGVISWIALLFCAQAWGSGASPIGQRGMAAPPVKTNTAPSKTWRNYFFKSFSRYPIPVDVGDLNGDRISDLAVGGYLENAARGCVVVHNGGSGGLRDTADWICNGDRPEQYFGIFLIIADFNGDKYNDLAVMDQPVVHAPKPGPSSIYLFYGSSNGLPAKASAIVSKRVGNYEMVIPYMANAGDVNGDGCADLALPVHDPADPEQVLSLALLYGSRTGLNDTPELVVREPQPEAGFPVAACAGDVNGDGYSDLIVSAPAFTAFAKRNGKAFLYLGSATGLAREAAWSSSYPLPVDPKYSTDQFFGYSVGPAGDVNHDGFDDVVIGAPYGTHGEVNEGLAFLYLGSPSGLLQRQSWFVEGNRPQVVLGFSVWGAGDVNRDGFSDVLVGIAYAEHGQKDEGVTLLFHGSSKGLEASPAWSLDGDQSSGHSGEWVRGAGDLNGDGAPDIVVAGTDAEQPNNLRLRVIAVYGSPEGLRHSSGWRVDKPLLTVIQQRLDQMSSGVVWLAVAAFAILAVVVLIFIQARLRKRIAQLVEENRALVVAQERARLARDMHDHLGADLTHVALQLHDAQQYQDGQAVRERLSNISPLVTRLISNLRELVWATMPECDTLESLVTFIGDQTVSSLEANSLRCELDFPLSIPDRKVSAELRHNLVLMVKEALTNVLKHASATSVRVSLRLDGNTIHLAIADDGQGFHPMPEHNAAVGPNGGAGLRGLKARAEGLHGRCSIGSTPGVGTTVTVSLPIEEPTGK